MSQFEARDAYYFSDSDNLQSKPYQLVDFMLGLDRQRWSFEAWIKNAFDETYDVLGYYFGNDPRIDYAPHGYFQRGAPRRYGVTLNWHL